MNITLNWTPGSGATSQDVQYKLASGSTWTTYATVSGSVNTSSISGLSDNLIYDFRVLSSCSGGSPSASSTVQQIKIICPTVTVTKTDTTVSYSFTAIGGSVGSYVVNLLDSTGTTVLQTNTAVSGTFSGLTASTTYKVRVTANAGTFTKVCPTQDVTTNAVAPCPAPTGLTATLDLAS
jgi:hypothetical protein